ncbi:MAG TPA: hypothetical protein PK185_12490 [Cyclobacteriaceae bacterium]|nr:hypothetical protein [Cyclobacteriaceae bacterium]
MKHRMSIRFGFLFPWTFRFIGIILILAATITVTEIGWFAILVFIPGIFLSLASEGFEIDTMRKCYREYYSFIFLKMGKYQPYQSIEKLFVNRSQESQRIYSAHTNKSSIFTNEVFNAYLKFSSGEKILLRKGKKKEKLIAQMNLISQSLQTQVMDNT